MKRGETSTKKGKREAKKEYRVVQDDGAHILFGGDDFVFAEIDSQFHNLLEQGRFVFQLFINNVHGF
jgi:hypothetical protein